MKSRAALAILVLLVTTVRAADDEPTPPTTERTDVVERPKAPPVKGVRYRVMLKTSRTLSGVVRARGVFEKPVGMIGFEPAEQDDREAGIRLWFPAQQDGFIFVPLDQIERMEEIGALSEAEGRAITQARADAQALAERRRAERIRELAAAEQARADAAEAAAEAQAETSADGGVDSSGASGGERTRPAESSADPKPAPAGEKPPTDTEREAGRLARLLVEFPPKRWTPDTPAEIQRRKVVLGLFPSDEERRFLDVFPDWKRAYDAWKAAEAADATRGGAGR